MPQETHPAIVWFRYDLRLHDQDALAYAIEQGHEILPVFIWAPDEESPWEPGGASRWWLHHALADLDTQLRDYGSRLIIRTGQSTQAELQKLIKETGAKSIFWNRRYEPAGIKRDSRIKSALKEQNLNVQSFNATLLYDPTKIKNKSGTPFKVFTPFWKHLRTVDLPKERPVDLDSLKSVKKFPKSLPLESLNLLPRISWDHGWLEMWQPQRENLLTRLRDFGKNQAASYEDQRDFPAIDGTSQLSPAFHFGQIGPREAFQHIRKQGKHDPALETGVLRQLYWREFANHLLFHFPHTSEAPLRPEYQSFPWQEDPSFLRAWQRGETGYPIVDAGMRQLWQTGWMHNRVRMIVASVLVKHLLQHWMEGAKWFWDTLVDANLANNTFGWQWTAGCGADAAPYFRVFNPIMQGEKFDPQGKYIKKFLPELEKLPKKYIHQPWELGALELRGLGVTLDKDYPSPIIPHPEGRQRALDAFAELKKRNTA